MPTLTMATAVTPAACEHLPEVAASVRAAQRALGAAGWDSEWLLVVDGPGPLPRFPTSESTRLVRIPTAAGKAACRNVAVVNGRGDWLLTVDCDEALVVPGLLGALAHPHLPGAGWLVGNRVRVDGSRDQRWRHGDCAWAPGQFAAARAAGAAWSTGPLLVRTQVALAVGGWPAVARDSNGAFAMLASEQFPGAGITEVLARCVTAPQPDPGPQEAAWVADGLLNARRALLGRDAVAPQRR